MEQIGKTHGTKELLRNTASVFSCGSLGQARTFAGCR